MPALKTPFFGSAYTSRSTDLADQQLINLYPEIVETKSGKNVGAFYGCPGLVLKAIAGGGPIQNFNVMNGILYVISGNIVYSITPNFVVTAIGGIDTSAPVPAMINNGNQLAIFTSLGGYLIGNGNPLTGGNINGGGRGYSVGDTINLIALLDGFTLLSGEGINGGIAYAIGDIVTLVGVDGTTVNSAQIIVTLVQTSGIDIGNITGFEVLNQGFFGQPPSSFTATGGSGAGFQLTNPIYSSGTPASADTTATAVLQVNAVGEFVLTGGLPNQAGSGYAIGDYINLTAIDGVQTIHPAVAVTSVVGGAVTGISVLLGGSFPVAPTAFIQTSTNGAGVGFTLANTTYSDGAVTAYSVIQRGSFNNISSIPAFGQSSTSGSGSGFFLVAPMFGAFVSIYNIVMPFTPSGDYPISATYCDGFGVISQPGTNIMWQSDELDLSQWNGLNFASASGDADNIIALKQQHREIFAIKQFDTEVWVNIGASGFVFSRLTSVFIEAGIVAQNSVSRLGETFVFLAQNKQGQGVVVQMRTYTPVRISTHAIEHAIQGYSTISDAIGFSYQQEGHNFYVITFPSGNATWVYDETASALAGMPMWHQRAAFLGGVFNRHWANCGISFSGFNLIGDYRNGNIYAFDLDVLLDNGTQRKFLRSWRALPQPTIDPVRFSELTIDMQTGIGIDPNDNPQVMLRWSDDGGHSWSNQIVMAVGVLGATAKRVKFSRLGSTRRNSGLDRIFELSSADVFPLALISADLK